MKPIRILALLICLSFVFVGCADKKDEGDYYETTLTFEKNGKVTDVIVESFSEPYYTEDGLRAFFQEKISEYNSSNIGDSDITLENLLVEDGKAKATLIFDSADTYAKFYGNNTFYGSVNDAYDKGYISETVLKKFDGNETISKNDLMKMKDSEIIIVNEIVKVVSPKKIEYVSANVEKIDDRTVRVSSDSTGMSYILLK